MQDKYERAETILGAAQHGDLVENMAQLMVQQRQASAAIDSDALDRQLIKEAREADEAIRRQQKRERQEAQEQAKAEAASQAAGAAAEPMSLEAEAEQAAEKIQSCITANPPKRHKNHVERSK